MNNVFDIAFRRTMGHEGGYVNDSVDRGGETYKGISRVHHASWPGWQTIDSFKAEENFPSCLDQSERLQGFVKDFYYTSFFKRYEDDAIDDALAIKMFDVGVNMGPATPIKFLQEALNDLNRCEKLYSNMTVDGGYGPTTRSCLIKYIEAERDRDLAVVRLLKLINIQQGQKYREIMNNDEKQERFARGWIDTRIGF